MPKYDVLAINRVYYSIEIEADSIQSANSIASDTPLEQWSRDDEELEIDLEATTLSN
jgi:hypothetical protein